MVLPIVAIAWLYVTLLMALAERSFVAGVATFLLYGLLPLSIALYLLATPARRKARARREREAADAGVDVAPADAAPVDVAPADDTPADDTPGDDAPAVRPAGADRARNVGRGAP